MTWPDYVVLAFSFVVGLGLGVGLGGVLFRRKPAVTVTMMQVGEWQVLQGCDIGKRYPITRIRNRTRGTVTPIVTEYPPNIRWSYPGPLPFGYGVWPVASNLPRLPDELGYDMVLDHE